MTDKEFLQWIHDRLENVHNENHDFDYMHKLREIISRTSVNHSWNGCVILINGEIFSGSRPGIYQPIKAKEGVPQYLPGEGLLYHSYNYKDAKMVLDYLRRNAPKGVSIKMAKVVVMEEED